jgi:four helix bundle protein
MTNEMTKDVGDCAAEELQFWQIVSEDDSIALHEDAPVVIYDLEERTARFGETIIRFAKKIPRSQVNNRLIDQLVGAGTSVGANYCEADDGVSRPDFKHRIGTCRKEARETKFFLRMVAVAEPDLKSEAREIWREAHALHRIFSRIWRNTKV